MAYLAAAALGYLLGCSNMTYYLAKLKNVDTSRGSGNLGTSNAMILMGWGAAVLVFIHDAGKAALAVLLARWLFPGAPLVGAVAGVAAVWGHIFPFYLKFKGGKGFAAYLGMTLALNWKLALVIGVLVVVIMLVTDYLVLGTFTTVVTVPAAMGFLEHSWPVVLVLLAATAVILFKHRENVTRLRNGTEIGFRSANRGDHRQK